MCNNINRREDINSHNYNAVKNKRLNIISNDFKKKILFGTAIFLSLLCCIFIVKDYSYAANTYTGRTLCYRPVMIEQGDSLWSIASDNMTEEWGSTAEYVKAIKEFNNMDTYDIYSGTYISIPYYDYVK